MRNIDHYLDAARARLDIRSDRQLAKTVGVSAPTLNGWRTKRAWPDDPAMCRLADLADVPRNVALIELNFWRAKGAARDVYKDLLKIVAVLAISINISYGANAEQVNMRPGSSVYYDKCKMCVLFRDVILKRLIFISLTWRRKLSIFARHEPIA